MLKIKHSLSLHFVTFSQTKPSIPDILFAVLKGEVIIVDEQNSWLTFVIRVIDVYKQGNHVLETDDQVEFKKRGTCLSPDLKKRKEYLFMGRDKNKQYVLDKSAWVKEWPKRGRVDQTLQDIVNGLQC